MGFNTSGESPRLMTTVGSVAQVAIGIATASGGLVEVTIPAMSLIQGVVGTPQESTGVAKLFVLTLTSGNNFTGELITVSGDTGTVTGTDVLMYMAWGKVKA